MYQVVRRKIGVLSSTLLMVCAVISSGAVLPINTAPLIDVASRSIDESATANLDPSPLVEDISSVSAVGVPGPLWALSDVPIPVTAGDEDTTPVPSVVAMASQFGTGRVVALGHDGFFTNQALTLFDNKRFANNIVDWLDKLARRKILITTGHQEWYGGTNFGSLKIELENRGYLVSRFSGSLTEFILSDVGVLIVGNAWGTFSESEIDVIRNFVANGDGLFLMGLGWSWENYNPGSTLDDYPMNKIGENFGVRWIPGYISDPTDNHDGQPIFHTFYPDIHLSTIYEAFSYISETTDAHPRYLPSLLQNDASVRTDYTNAHLLLATATEGLSESSTERQEIYDFYLDLTSSHPQYYGKNVVYDRYTESTMAWIRERTYRSLIDALPLTDGRKDEISIAIGLVDQYLNIWDDFTVMLLDNTCLNEVQREFIYSYLSLVPNGLHNLRSISVIDFLGSTSPEITLGGSGGAVNIFGYDIGASLENSFPDDVSPGYVDVFCIVVAHEVNHVVDAFYIRGSQSLDSRRDELIAAAGRNPLNYLRSMLPEGFFADNPHEFFASIANQWFTNSTRTVELGLVRFDAGHLDPINQALFFADVYSMGGDYTYFYTTDMNGDIARYLVQLTRNTKGQIDSLTLGDSICHFELDADGNVMAYWMIGPTIQATIDFDPDTLNLKSRGKFVTCNIELPEGYDVADIDVSTVLLSGTIPAQPKPTEIGDHDIDGIPDLRVKFSREQVIAMVRAGNGELTLTGELADGTPFEGTDTIRVKG